MVPFFKKPTGAANRTKIFRFGLCKAADSTAQACLFEKWNKNSMSRRVECNFCQKKIMITLRSYQLFHS